jgi:hypothetical protein
MHIESELKTLIFQLCAKNYVNITNKKVFPIKDITAKYYFDKKELLYNTIME